MFSSLFSVFSALLVVLPLLVNAAPVNSPAEFLAFAPTILTPTAGVTWPKGSTQIVSWRTDNIPDAAKNYTVVILLGYDANNSENLDIKNPLATQIPITAGSASITVPSNATSRPNYIVALIGDSGDTSPEFTIQ